MQTQDPPGWLSAWICALPRCWARVPAPQAPRGSRARQEAIKGVGEPGFSCKCNKFLSLLNARWGRDCCGEESPSVLLPLPAFCNPSSGTRQGEAGPSLGCSGQRPQRCPWLFLPVWPHSDSPAHIPARLSARQDSGSRAETYPAREGPGARGDHSAEMPASAARVRRAKTCGEGGGREAAPHPLRSS